MNTKILRTFLLSAIFLLAGTLWWTRDEFLPSLSAFANSSNVIFYHAMHLCASWFFITNAEKSKHNLDYWVGFGMGAILLTNMYDYQLAHNIFTAATLGLAIFSLIFYAKGREKIINIVLGGFAIGIFLVGYLNESFHFLFAEVLAMFSIAVGMAREMWVKRDTI